MTMVQTRLGEPDGPGQFQSRGRPLHAGVLPQNGYFFRSRSLRFHQLSLIYCQSAGYVATVRVRVRVRGRVRGPSPASHLPYVLRQIWPSSHSYALLLLVSPNACVSPNAWVVATGPWGWDRGERHLVPRFHLVSTRVLHLRRYHRDLHRISAPRASWPSKLVSFW